MHDPAEAVRRYLLMQAELTDLVGDQVAVGMHRFGSGWETPSKAILLLPSGGGVELYTPLRRMRIYATCYAPSYAEVAEIVAALVAVTKAFARTEVTLGEHSRVLIQALNQGSEATQTWEPELEIPAYGLYLEAITAEITGE